MEDAYSLSKNIQTQKNIVDYPTLICKNKTQSSLKEVVKLDSSNPSILQIIKASGKAILDEVKIIKDKVVAEGVVECNILYITNNDENPMYSYNVILPYQQVIDAKNADPKTCVVDISVYLENIGVNMLTDKEIETRFTLNFESCVTLKNQLGFIVDVIFNEIDKDKLDQIGSMTIYVVQKGDTLWELAKKFNTTIDDIVELNDIENPDLIYPGQKLLILKKVC